MVHAKYTFDSKGISTLEAEIKRYSLDKYRKKRKEQFFIINDSNFIH